MTEDGVEIFTSRPKAGTSRHISDRLRWPIWAATSLHNRITRAIANACASAFWPAAPSAMPDYELMELVLFAAIPRRDVKPLAKR